MNASGWIMNYAAATRVAWAAEVLKEVLKSAEHAAVVAKLAEKKEDVNVPPKYQKFGVPLS
jgi:hypothetical protein